MAAWPEKFSIIDFYLSECATGLIRGVVARALHLIEELGCGEITSSAFDCSAGAPREGKRFTASLSRINAILGIEVPERM